MSKVKTFLDNIARGDLSALYGLRDHLFETHDARRDAFDSILQDFLRGVGTIQRRWPDGAGSPVSDGTDLVHRTDRRGRPVGKQYSREELAYRRDEDAFRRFRNLCDQLTHLFWSEVGTRSVAQQVEEASEIINPQKQAARLFGDLTVKDGAGSLLGYRRNDENEKEESAEDYGEGDMTMNEKRHLHPSD